MIELWRALACLLEPPTTQHRELANALGLGEVPGADVLTDLFVFQAYPYASVYLGATGMLGGEPRDRIAGFWRAIDVEPPAEPDHLGALVHALAQLAEHETHAAERPAAAIRAARRTLFHEHIASWMPPYLDLVRRVGAPFYVRWADVTEAALAVEAELLGPDPALCGQLRDRASLVDLGHGSLDEILAAVLAPARVGFTIVRDDLQRASAELGLGCRVGERRFVLRSLLAQDASAVFAWLAAEARRQAEIVGQSQLAIASWWVEQAQRSACWLDELATAATSTRAFACG